MQEKEKNICIERVVSCAPVLLCCGGDVRDLVTQPAWKRFGTCDGRIELAKRGERERERKMKQRISKLQQFARMRPCPPRYHSPKTDKETWVTENTTSQTLILLSCDSLAVQCRNASATPAIMDSTGTEHRVCVRPPIGPALCWVTPLEEESSEMSVDQESPFTAMNSRKVENNASMTWASECSHRLPYRMDRDSHESGGPHTQKSMPAMNEWGHTFRGGSRGVELRHKMQGRVGSPTTTTSRRQAT